MRARALQTLYGESVLPEVILETFNASLTERVTVVQAAREEAALRRNAFRVLYAHVLVVEDKPVPTRFWLFAACVGRLLSMRLMDLPVDAFTLRLVSPSQVTGGCCAFTTGTRASRRARACGWHLCACS